ncbi:MAG: Uncharacterised protein [Opitutia bacterium UBA7350]|nr:MAG: Uncharacterised protein [Opitutae bacterium UBA7350]
MKEQNFRDLLNLYLDGELSPEDESRLAELIASDAELRADFMQACRLHGATQMALNPQALQPKDLNQRYFWSRLFIGMAAASCAVLGAMFLMPCVISDEAAHISVPLCAQDPYLNNAVIEQVNKDKEAPSYEHSNACLAAHFRLQGLEPAISPADIALMPLDPSEHFSKHVIPLSEVNFKEEAERLLSSELFRKRSRINDLEFESFMVDPLINRVQNMGFSGSLVVY